MKEKLKSRKLWVSIGSVLAVILTDWANLSPEMAENIVTAVVTITVAYVGGQSVVDAAKELLLKGKNEEPPTS